ncbi:MAG: universal stress protein [Deltaproteobacteria bacterium]|nr:MAG: universal stress protein [Deltaproteobacteria bacterium]
MKRANHILVGTDFSEQADSALLEAVRLARRHGSRITLLHIIDETPSDSRWMVFGVPPADIEDALRKRADEELAKRVEGICADVPTETDIVFGKPSVTLVREAGERGAGLIVVGRTGESMMERLLLGSTAERLLRQAPQMVLVVRPGGDPGFRRILAPVDFSDYSRDSLEVAARIARDENAELHVLHAYEYAGLAQIASATSITATQSFQEELEEQSRRQLQTLIDEVDLKDLTPQLHLRVGLAAQEIITFARDEQVDLVVMGSIGRTGLKRLFIGNTAERVIRSVPSSVLTVKPSDFRPE